MRAASNIDKREAIFYGRAKMFNALTLTYIPRTANVNPLSGASCSFKAI